MESGSCCLEAALRSLSESALDLHHALSHPQCQPIKTHVQHIYISVVSVHFHQSGIVSVGRFLPREMKS
eukprot:1527650-Rhodomonas_salina.1